MNLRKQHVIGFAIAALVLATGGRVLAQEQKPFSPAIEQLRETVAERLRLSAASSAIRMRICRTSNCYSTPARSAASACGAAALPASWPSARPTPR